MNWTALALIALFVFLGGIAAGWWTPSGDLVAAFYIGAAVVIFITEGFVAGVVRRPPRNGA